jgi:hypothetical protein
MKRSLLLVTLLSSALFAAEPTALFDGKTFKGWEGDTATTWRIENGEIVAGSLEKKQPRNEFLSTKESFGNFELKLEFKLSGVPGSGFINGGVQFRSERIKEPAHEMSGYQADIGDPKYWGALYDESRRKKMLAEVDMTKLEPVLKRDGWNSYVIRCEGPRIQLWINGVQTVDYTEADATIPLTGKIAVQIHGGANTEVRYRKLMINPL